MLAVPLFATIFRLRRRPRHRCRTARLHLRRSSPRRKSAPVVSKQRGKREGISLGADRGGSERGLAPESQSGQSQGRGARHCRDEHWQKTGRRNSQEKLGNERRISHVASSLIVVEGEFSAMAVYQAMRRLAASLPNGYR